MKLHLLVFIGLMFVLACDETVYIKASNVNEIDSTATITIYQYFVDDDPPGLNCSGPYNEKHYENVHISKIDSLKLAYEAALKAERISEREDRKLERKFER